MSPVTEAQLRSPGKEPGGAVSSSQRRTLEVFLALRLLHRRAPTLMELARSLRVTRQAVHYRLHWLEKKGLWNGSGRTITEPGLRSALDALTR